MGNESQTTIYRWNDRAETISYTISRNQQFLLAVIGLWLHGRMVEPRLVDAILLAASVTDE